MLKKISCIIMLLSLFFSTTLLADEFKFLKQQTEKAKALVGQKNYDLAIAELRRAMFVSDQYGLEKRDLWQWMGYCWYAKGRIDLTIDCYKVAFVCASYYDDDIKRFLGDQGVTVQPDYEPKYTGVYTYAAKMNSLEEAQNIKLTVIQKSGRKKSNADFFAFDTTAQGEEPNSFLWVPGLIVGSIKVKASGLSWGAGDWQTFASGIAVPDYIYEEFIGKK